MAETGGDSFQFAHI